MLLRFGHYDTLYKSRDYEESFGKYDQVYAPSGSGPPPPSECCDYCGHPKEDEQLLILPCQHRVHNKCLGGGNVCPLRLCGRQLQPSPSPVYPEHPAPNPPTPSLVPSSNPFGHANPASNVHPIPPVSPALPAYRASYVSPTSAVINASHGQPASPVSSALPAYRASYVLPIPADSPHERPPPPPSRAPSARQIGDPPPPYLDPLATPKEYLWCRREHFFFTKKSSPRNTSGLSMKWPPKP